MSGLDAAQPPAGRLILASRSERRRQLLQRLVPRFDCRPAGVDESSVGGAAREVVERLAVIKASEVLSRCVQDGGRREGLRVLGADTVIAVSEGDAELILGKPVDARDARRMIARLSGCSHRVYTGLAVCRPGREPETAVEVTEVRLRALRDDEIDAYVATGEPLDKAGAYGIQGEGARLIDGIDGCFYNVVGLPLSLTASLLGPLVAAGARLCDCAAHPLQRGVPRCAGERSGS